MIKGSKHTSTAKEKNRLNHLGKIAWNKGKECPEISGNKNPFYGKKHSEETKRVMKLKRSKQIISEETKLKMSKTHKKIGAPWMLGMTQSYEIRKKRSESLPKGERHHNWNGGSTPINQQIRVSFEYKNWRREVFERDNYLCRECGLKSGQGKAVVLHADHVKPFAYYPELRFEVNNGRTLCIDCHKKTDTYAGKAIKFNKLNISLCQ